MASIKIHLRGSLAQYVSVNDIGIHTLGIIGTEGAKEKEIFIDGPSLSMLNEDDKAILADILSGVSGSGIVFSTEDADDPDDSYEAIYDINLSDIEPLIAKNGSALEINSADAPVDMVIIGGLNGRLSDIKAAYEIIKNRHVAKDLEAIVIPLSPEVYKEAIKKGYIEEFIDAGYRVFPPGYIPECKDDASCISTMCGFESSCFAASPQVAAASSITGKISDPRIVDSKAERKAEKKNEKRLEKAEKLAEKAEKAAAKAEAAANKTK